ncbi:unnamed protein product [Durusdinium trenchii]|uniref:Cullin family profile domain-containing protein n=1 Tax=Durusdinium trenchii TaxID=1381693 RepID=A0ABP0MWG3_9DINO
MDCDVGGPSSFVQRLQQRGPLGHRPRVLVRGTPRAPRAGDEAGVSALREAVKAICSETFSGSREQLYRHVEALCVSGRGQQVFQELLEEVATQLDLHLATVADREDSQLQELVCVWRKMGRVFKDLCKIYSFLDRSRNPRREAFADLFRARLAAALDGASLRAAAAAGARRLLDAERRQEAMDPELLKSLVELLRSLDFYKDFEVAFLEQSAQFYREASDCWQREKSLAEYLLLADEHLKAEEQRCDTYHLEPSTLQPLLEVLRQEVLAKKAEDLLELGFAQLVCDVQVSDLGRLYRHYKEVDALAHLRKAFGEAVRQGGRRAMQSSEDAKQVVPELVRWLGSTQEVLSLAFGNDAGSAIAQKEAFEGFLNAAPNHAAKLLTRYLDVLLRGDEVTPAEPLAFAPPARVEKESLEVRIQRALQIFRYLAAKDAFEAFFKKDLAKRLLQRSASEGELAATTWLREECGGAYTAGIEGMFQDMEISRVLAQVFHSEAKTLLEERICLSEVSVLTTGKWPSVPSSPAIKLPMPIQRLMTSFEAFYGQQHRGRSLRWCPAWGRCWLRANAAAKKELVVSHFQALVLLCFNGSDVLSYEKLQELTQIPPAELQLTLQSLSLHRTVKLLLKENPKERDVLPGETFSYHANFTHKLYRITVSQISPKEQLQEEDAVEQRVVGSRQHELDAVVIRVMKSKKRMTHQELLAEVLSSVRFPVEAAELQRRIESLIEREYLERQPPNDQGIISYIYLA